jgi:hypothetical protein
MGFREWHAKNDVISDTVLLPDKVRNWSDRSWLKHFDHYLVRNDLYFSYPRSSHSTNFSDAGTHAEISSPHFQVSIEPFVKHIVSFNFADFSSSKSVYDAYFELSANIFQREVPAFKSIEFVVDLQATKPVSKFPEETLFLTSRNLKSGCVPKLQFGLHLKPIENNIIYNSPGSVFNLIEGKNLSKSGRLKSKPFSLYLLDYFYGRISQRTLFQGLLIHIKRKVRVR